MFPRFFLICSILLSFQTGCTPDYFEWDLARKNPADSLQNQNEIFPDGPVARFSSDTRSVVSGGQVTFLDRSVGSPTEFNWSFPGGSPSSSTSVSPVITYAGIHKFDVGLHVLNSVAGDSVYAQDYIESYYSKSFANNQYDGWAPSPANAWQFTQAGQQQGSICAWQNSTNAVLSYSLTKQFSDVDPNSTVSFFYYVYSPGGKVVAKINNNTVFSKSGYGSGTAVFTTGNFTAFTLSIVAEVGYTQSVYINSIEIHP